MLADSQSCHVAKKVSGPFLGLATEPVVIFFFGLQYFFWIHLKSMIVDYKKSLNEAVILCIFI